MTRRILVIDNYDSFVYNLVQYLGEMGQELIIKRNDEVSASSVKKLNPSHILISPGPGRPEDAGACREIINEFAGKKPILGVCLGHECIAVAFGAKVVSAGRMMHGKTSMIYHNKKNIFKGMKNPFEATRYHSLIVEPKSVSMPLRVTAKTDMGEIMAIEHAKYPVVGLQFHPESILSETGRQILKNFIEAR